MLQINTKIESLHTFNLAEMMITIVRKFLLSNDINES